MPPPATRPGPRRHLVAVVVASWLMIAPGSIRAECPVASRLLPDIAGQVDTATATWRDRGRLAAMPLYRAALADLPRAATMGTASLPGTATITSERIAAARAAVGQVEAATAVLQTCWAQHRGAQRCRAGPLADVLELGGDWEAASKLLDDEMRGLQRPDEAMFLARIGLASRHDDGEAEVRVARAALAHWPGSAALHEALATALFRLKEHVEALSAMGKLASLAPNTPGILARVDGIQADMGRVAHHGDDSEAARRRVAKEFEARAAADPNDLVARFVAGAIAYRRGQFERAAAAMKAVHKRRPGSSRPLIYLAMVRYWQGDEAQARTLAIQARDLAPEDPEAWFTLARITQARQPDMAIANLERYLALASTPGRLQFSGKVRKARKLLTRLRAGRKASAGRRPGERPTKPTPDSLRDPFELPPPPLLFGGLGVILFGLGLGWLWRSQR